MIEQVVITIKPEDENNLKLINSLLLKELKNNQKAKLINFKTDKIDFLFDKKSIDARRGTIKIHLRYKAFINEDINQFKSFLPSWKQANSNKQVLIIGSGPAGLFAALKLLEYGIKPIILERGCNTQQRRKDVALISTKNFVNEDSNYCFGEGGAGTFSDGKLYTRSNKRGNIENILQVFVHFGADQKILTDAHPHIGTDKLPSVINSMTKKILDLGGEIYFNTKVTNFILDKNKINGVITKNVISNEQNQFLNDTVILATGHSATDIYELLANKSPNSLEAKTFAMGVRVEHPRSIIDSIQFHGNTNSNLYGAEYRVAVQIEDRGVYSFCMCPGGFVVPSSTKDNEIVVNGMSTKARNSKWSNAAIVVETRPEDIPQKFIEQAKKQECQALSGLFYRTFIEQEAKKQSKSQKAPSQLVKDFIQGNKTLDFPDTSYSPGLYSSDFNEWLPKNLCDKLKKGLLEINKNIKGYICDKALMIGPETRTSTPVRIVRDKDSLESLEIKGLFPCGEGSGYSGGIVSSAMDGEKVAQKIAEKI